MAPILPVQTFRTEPRGWRVLVVWECALKARLVAEAAQLTAAWLREEHAFSVIEPTEKAEAGGR